MDTQHTPGPWKIGAGEALKASVYAGTLMVAFAREQLGQIDSTTAQANARLIAASPELLDLAYQYLSDMRYPPTGDSLQRRIERAEAIIAKATGQ